MAGHHEDKVALTWIMNNVRDVLQNYAREVLNVSKFYCPYKVVKILTHDL
jgi:hypothetical protein